MVWKKVLNSDAGDADHVGGNDWDKVMDLLSGVASVDATTSLNGIKLISPTIEGATISFRRTDTGDNTIEFGPNDATGGAAIFDFHNNSADGDYRTRFVRNSTSNGIFEFKQTGGGSFQLYNAANINTTTSQTRSVYMPVTIDTVGATPTQYNTLELYSNYLATQPTSGFSVTHAGIKHNMDYGSGVVNAKGTVNMIGSSINIQGSATTDNEINNLSLYNKASNSALASQWLTDFIMYGPVAAQPGELSGITFLMNNYYNGSPSRRPSHMLGLQTNVDAGAFKSADHVTATAYKLDYGILVQGYAGTLASPTRGFEVAMLIGGNGANWMNPATYVSKIGTGIQFKDIESKGIELLDPATSASSPVGITSTGATRAWDMFIDFSGGLAPTTTAIKLGTRPLTLNTGKIYESAANTYDLLAISNTTSLLRLLPNVTTVANTTTRGTLQIANTANATDSEYMALDARGTNGYFIDVIKAASGSLRTLKLAMSGNACITINTDNSMDFNSRAITNAVLTSPTVNTPTVKYSDVTKVTGDSPYSIATTDDTIRADASSGALTVTLPTAVGVTGKQYVIRRKDILVSTVLVTVATTSSQTIAGAPAWYLWPGEFVTVRSDGANWEVIAEPARGGPNYYQLKNATNNRRYVAGMYQNVALLTSTTSPAANTLWAIPLVVPKVTKFSTITFAVTTTAACNARMGIYRDNGNVYPGALVFDSGSIDCSTGTNKDSTITAGLQVFPPGLYWLAWECDTANIQIRVLGGSGGMYGLLGNANSLSANAPSYGYSVAHTFGALPDPYTSSATVLTTFSSATNPVPAIGLLAI